MFVRRFDGGVRNDLFAVAKNEPAARSLEPLPWAPLSGLTPAGAPWREDASLTGNIDVPGEGAIVKEALRVSGWARVAGEDLDVIFLVDGEVRRPESAGRTPRADVCEAVPGLSDCSRAGYEATFAFGPRDGGAHEIVVLLRSKDGRERHFPARRFVWQGAR